MECGARLGSEISSATCYWYDFEGYYVTFSACFLRKIKYVNACRAFTECMLNKLFILFNY